MVSKHKIIAIDGPSSSGKGTIAKIVAHKLGFSYLDSGSIYRTLGLLVVRNHLDAELNVPEILDLIAQMDLSFNIEGVFIAGENISDKIRDEKVGMMASILGKNPKIRESLLKFQRDFALKNDLVTDGRDMGSVVFPDAQLKVFLSASVDKRAQRRFNQLQLLEKSVKMESILRDIQIRDEQDSSRAVAPLRYDSSYKKLDNTDLSIDDCVNQILLWYQQSIQ